MRRTISLSVLCILGMSGCQGMGGYSAQSITRVPPIGTNSYQVPGNYYGNAAPAPMTNGASMSGSSTNGASTNGAPLSGNGGLAPASGQLPSTASYGGSNFTGTGMSDVATAQYDMPSTPVGSGVTNASALSSPSSDNGQLQWQR